MNKHFSKEDIKMTNKHKKRCPASLIIREIQSKITVRCHFTFISTVFFFLIFQAWAIMWRIWKAYTLLAQDGTVK